MIDLSKIVFPNRTDKLEIVDLTSEQQDKYDPTRKGRQFLKGMEKEGDFTPTPPEFRKFPKDVYLDWKAVRDKRLAYNSPHLPILRYEDELAVKCGPQGKRVALSALKDSLHELYRQVPRSINPDILRRGVRYLLQRIRDRVQLHVPQPIRGIGVTGTSAGLSTMLKKGQFYAETIAMTAWRHVKPDLIGQRYQRSSARLIHNDDVCNVRYIENLLSEVRFYLRREFPEYFGSWLPPYKWVEPCMHAAVHSQYGFSSAEADYEKCDRYFSRDLAMELLPIYEAILTPGDYLHFASFIEELFEQPVFLGEEMWTGLHNLFSGQGITNDFETLYDVCQMLGVLLSLGVSPIGLEGPKPRLISLSNGDDMTLIEIYRNPSQRDSRFSNDYLQAYAEAAASCNMIIHPDKSRISTEDIRFCRRVYYPALKSECVDGNILGVRGAYPSNFTLMSLYHPESHQPDATLRAIACLSRLDNLYGSPLWSPFVEYVLSRRTPSYPLPDQLEQAASDYTDWWYRVYNTRFDLRKSPTYSIILKRNLRF